MLSRKFVAVLLSLLFLLTMTLTAIQAQEGQPPAAGTGSNYTMFGVICETQAVINLTGTMEPGFDMYYQVFSGPRGTGSALTALRRVQVDGTFTFSERVNYTEGMTVPFGSTGSFYVTISREGNPDSSAFNEYVDDIQDGCAEPQHPIGASVDTGTTVTGVDATTTTSPGTTAQGTSNILSPFGGVLNPNYIPPDKPLVVVGPREPFVRPRQETPGLIFAECRDYPVAEPGIIYDNDDVIVFWSWFARTPELVQEHIDTVNYSVTYYHTLPLPNVVRSEIQQRGTNWWVFYYSRLGNLRPGLYYIEYDVTWDRAISDGFEDFGPGTDNPVLRSGCGFTVLPNLEGRSIGHNPWPYQ